MNKEKIVNIPIFYGKLKIVIVKSWECFDKNHNTNIATHNYEGLAMHDEKLDLHIVAIRGLEWSIIAHEVVHVVNSIYERIGAQLDIKNDEPQAYLTEWVINEIDIFLKEQKIKTK